LADRQDFWWGYNKGMRKVLIWLMGLMIGWMVVRFVIGGPEDDWICAGGEWVKHGYPSGPKPGGGCE